MARIQEDDTTTLGETDTIPDVGDLVGFGNFSGCKIVTLSAASHDFDIDFASSQSGKLVQIRKARIKAVKI